MNRLNDAELSNSSDTFPKTENTPNEGVAECSKSFETLEIASNINSNDPGLWPIISSQSNQSNQINLLD